jgi:outer membrane receptor for ferrienterochelin and colicin
VGDIKNMPMVFGELDILKVVAALPGVKSSGDISSGFNVRGGATDQNLILYNDGTIFNPTHLFGLFSAFNPDIVRDMELYKSSIPTRYGGRISSVLDIRSREGNKKAFTGSGSLGLLTSRLTLEGPLWKDRTSLIVGARTTYSDWLLSLLPEKSGYKNGSADFWDINTSLSHRFNERNNLFIDGYYSQDRFRFEEYEDYDYRNANASVKWRRVINNRSLGIFSVGYDHYDHSTRNTKNEATAYNLDFGIDQLFAKADFTIQTGDNHSLGFGLNAQYYDMKPGSFSPWGENSIVAPQTLQNERALESALYLSDKWTVTDQLEVDYGLRWSMFNALGPRDYTRYNPNYLPSEGTITEQGHKNGVLKTYTGPDFRLSARYSIADDLSVKMGVNSLRQYIHKISNNTVMSPTDTWKLSDINIGPQKGVQYSMGLYKDLRNRFVEITLEGYYKTIEDYLDYRSGARLMMNPNIEQALQVTRGRAYGIELMIRRIEGKLNGWASYTWSRTELRQDDPRIPLPTNGGNWYPADFDKPHEVKVVANYRFTHRYSISVNADYATGRPITLPIAKYNYAGGEYLFYSNRNEHRVPDYFRLDFSINIEPSHHLTLLTHSMFSIGVYNLTGRKNAHSVYYKQEAGKVRGYKLSIFGAPIPYISYNIKF